MWLFLSALEKYWADLAEEKSAAAKATSYLLATIEMSTINRHHHVRVEMEM